MFVVEMSATGAEMLFLMLLRLESLRESPDACEGFLVRVRRIDIVCMVCV